MKKTLLLISALALDAFSYSQTIRDTNVVNVGDTIMNAVDAAPSINISGTGTGNNWNFSSLLANTRDTAVFLHPNSISCAPTSFPFATHSFKQDTLRAFLKRSSTQLELIGISNGTICVASENAETVIKFPSSYGSTFMDTAKTVATVSGASVGQPLADSIKVINVIYIESDFSASGTLTTPYGVFAVIRQKVTRKTSTDTYAKGALTGGVFTLLTSEKDTAYSHQYWSDAANAKFPLVSYDMNAAGNLTGGVTWIFNFSANVYSSIIENELRTLKVFPNPASNQLTLDLDEKINELRITDLTGKTVFSKSNVIGNKIDVNGFDSGVYVITVKTDSYTATSRFIKE